MLSVVCNFSKYSNIDCYLMCFFQLPRYDNMDYNCNFICITLTVSPSRQS